MEEEVLTCLDLSRVGAVCDSCNVFDGRIREVIDDCACFAQRRRVQWCSRSGSSHVSSRWQRWHDDTAGRRFGRPSESRSHPDEQCDC